MWSWLLNVIWPGTAACFSACILSDTSGTRLHQVAWTMTLQREPFSVSFLKCCCTVLQVSHPPSQHGWSVQMRSWLQACGRDSWSNCSYSFKYGWGLADSLVPHVVFYDPNKHEVVNTKIPRCTECDDFLRVLCHVQVSYRPVSMVCLIRWRRPPRSGSQRGPTTKSTLRSTS